jgi:DNA-binding LytR/AlgR family response regulator
LRIQTLIIEPGADDLKRLKEMLHRYAPDIEIVRTCKRLNEAKKWLSKNNLPDLVFSVVQLADGLSFEVFRQHDIPVIFTCAFDKYAFEAFKVHSVHFLKKPIQKEDLEEALARFRELFTQRRASAKMSLKSSTHTKHFQQRFVVNIGKQMKLVEAKDIAYFYTENKVVYLVTINGEKLTMDLTMEQLERLLDPNYFFRINRQFIVQIISITRMLPASKSRLKLVLKPDASSETITSVERTANFRKWLMGAS